MINMIKIRQAILALQLYAFIYTRIYIHAHIHIVFTRDTCRNIRI